MKLIKMAFALSVVAFLMPTPPEPAVPDPQPATAEAGVSGDLIGAAAETVEDVSHFCTRRAAVCETARHLLHRFEAKAKYGVRLLYEWANESTTDDPMPYPYRDQAGLSDPAIELAGSNQPAAQNTLSIDDLIPEWRGPRAARQI